LVTLPKIVVNCKTKFVLSTHGEDLTKVAHTESSFTKYLNRSSRNLLITNITIQLHYELKVILMLHALIHCAESDIFPRVTGQLPTGQLPTIQLTTKTAANRRTASVKRSSKRNHSQPRFTEAVLLLSVALVQWLPTVSVSWTLLTIFLKPVDTLNKTS